MKQMSYKVQVAGGKQRMKNRKRVLGLVVLAAMVVLALAGCGGAGEQAQAVSQANTPAPVDTPTSAPTNTPTVAPTDTPTTVPTDTPTPEPTATPTPAPTDTPVPSDRPAASEEIVYTGTQYAADGSPQVNLSFDVQGDPEQLRKILDILDEYGVRTTFFVQGEWMDLYPEATQEIARRGHELGNHSWTHFNFSEMTAEEVTKELEDTEALVQELTGQTTKPYFRPPFGSRSQLSIKTAYDLGYTTIIWTYGADEWRDGATAQTIYDNVYGNKAPGALYYTHTDRQIIIDALPRLIEAFQADGYKLVTAGEILTPSEAAP